MTGPARGRIIDRIHPPASSGFTARFITGRSPAAGDAVAFGGTVRNRRLLFPGVTILLSLAAAAPARAGADEPAPVSVYAAAVLSETLERVGVAFTQKNGIPVRVTSGSSGDLAMKILDGASADVFVSAGAASLMPLKQVAIVDDGTSFEWMFNRLVVIAPAGRNDPLKSADDLVAKAIKHIVIADPASVPSGVYAKQSLRSLGLWDALQGRIITSLDGRSVVASVEKKESDFGIVLATDARRSRSVRVVLDLPDDSHASIRFDVALIARPGRMAGANTFLEFLRGPETRQILADLGFTPNFP